MIFSTISYYNGSDTQTDLYFSNNSARDWYFLASTNRTSYVVNEYDISLCYYDGSIFLVGRFYGAKRSYAGALSYHLDSEPGDFHMTNLTDLVGYALHEFQVTSTTDELFLCARSHMNETYGLTFIHLSKGLWNHSFCPFLYLVDHKMSNCFEGEDPLILYKESENKSLNLVRFNSTEVLNQWQPIGDGLYDFDIVQSRSTILIAYHDGIVNQTFNLDRLSILLGRLEDGFEEIYSTEWMERLELESVGYVNKSKQYHLIEGTSSNMTEIVINEITGTISKRFCSHYFKTYMPKFSYGESPHGIFLITSGNESLYSSIYSIAPTIPSSSILYRINDSIPLWKLYSPLIISIFVIPLVTLIVTNPRNWVSKIKKPLFKRCSTVSRIHNRTTVFYPKPLMLPLNIGIGLVSSLAVAQIVNALVTFSGICSPLVLFSSLSTLFIVVVYLTEREMVWKAVQILNLTKNSLSSSDEPQQDIENLLEILSTITESDPSLLLEMASDDLLYSPDKHTLESEINETICNLLKRTELYSERKENLIESYESLFSGKVMECEDKVCGLSILAKKHRFSLCGSVLSSFLVAFSLWYVFRVHLIALPVITSLLLLIASVISMVLHDIPYLIETTVKGRSYLDSSSSSGTEPTKPRLSE